MLATFGATMATFGATMEPVFETFIYLHCNPFRKHLVQLQPNGQVLLMSSEMDYPGTMSSGWHGHHTAFSNHRWNRAFNRRFQMSLHYAGDRAHALRVLDCHPDMPGTFNCIHQ